MVCDVRSGKISVVIPRGETASDGERAAERVDRDDEETDDEDG